MIHARIGRPSILLRVVSMSNHDRRGLLRGRNRADWSTGVVEQ